MSKKQKEPRAAIIKAARDKYQEEGKIEIDDCARISRDHDNPEKGCYVQAWVWVYDEEVKQ